MSSTKRQSPDLRHAADYYVTPVPAIRDFLNAFHNDYKPTKTFTILDPCAGGDATHAMSYPHALKTFAWFAMSKVTTIDIRQDSNAEIKTDFLQWETAVKYDLVITNPPFFLAQEITNHALKIVPSGAFVIMLLRLNFFGGAKRFKWWQDNMPQTCYVHSKRIGFTDNGKTDSIEYMHAVWVKGEKNKFTQLRVI